MVLFNMSKLIFIYLGIRKKRYNLNKQRRETSMGKIKIHGSY